MISSLAQSIDRWMTLFGSRSRTGLLMGLMTGAIAGAAMPGLAQPVAGVARPELYLGVQSESVGELQGMLRLLGFFRGEVSGLYGDDTQNAVIQFQTAAGILPNGRVSGATWARLLPGVAVGATVAAAPKPTATVVPNPPAATVVPKPGATAASSFPKPAAAPVKPAVAPAKPAVAAAPMFPILRKGDRGPAVETLQKRLVRLGVLAEGADGVFGEGTMKGVMAAQRKFGIEADGVVGPATWDALLQ